MEKWKTSKRIQCRDAKNVCQRFKKKKKTDSKLQAIEKADLLIQKI